MTDEEGSEQDSYEDDDSEREQDELQRQLYNEYGYEEEYADALEGEEILDNQDLDAADREVLNDRILGIINVFALMQNTNNNSKAFSSKYIRALEELGKKNLSIEKKDMKASQLTMNQPDSSAQLVSGLRAESGAAQANNLKAEGAGMRGGSRETLEVLPQKKAFANTATGTLKLLSHCNSKRELGFGSLAP